MSKRKNKKEMDVEVEVPFTEEQVDLRDTVKSLEQELSSQSNLLKEREKEASINKSKYYEKGNLLSAANSKIVILEMKLATANLAASNLMLRIDSYNKKSWIDKLFTSTI